MVIGVLLIVRWCSSSKNPSGFEIENSPIKIETIKNIAQLATVSYKDEVVVDSVEYYRSQSEQIIGNFNKLTDIENFKHALKGSRVDRRLTLIVKGEIHIGFNLKDEKFKIKEEDSLITVYIPEPIFLDVLSSPSSTRIFQEIGRWQDYEIRVLKNKSRKIMQNNAMKLGLQDKAKANIQKFISQLIQKKKSIKYVFKK
jgi:hypothetical protein